MSVHFLQRRNAGFSLVEIMVGMAIGMVGIIVVMQMYAVFQNQKRTTSSGDDAQNNGAIALYQLQRDIQHSGYGISNLDLLGCGVTLRTGVTLSAIAPVTINHASIPAADANTDTLLVVYGNANVSAQGDMIDRGNGTTYSMKNAPTALVNDRVVAESNSLLGNIPNPGCSLFLDTVSALPGGKDITMATGGVVDGTLYNLGQAPTVRAYAIRNRSLTVCNYMQDDCGLTANKDDPTVWVPIASDIVSLRAQYGQDITGRSPVTAATKTASMDGIVDAYSQTTPTHNCGWIRTSAVRIALVARGATRGEQVISAAPTWAGSAGAAISLTADSDWQRYHYKVFETTVPLRNIAWMGVETNC